MRVRSGSNAVETSLPDGRQEYTEESNSQNESVRSGSEVTSAVVYSELHFA